MEWLDHLVCLDPPKEANVPAGYICRLSKCVYGLTDDSRSCYLTLRLELMKSEAVASKYDCFILTFDRQSGNQQSAVSRVRVSSEL